jgi:hypothetical protein
MRPFQIALIALVFTVALFAVTVLAQPVERLAPRSYGRVLCTDAPTAYNVYTPGGNVHSAIARIG